MALAMGIVGLPNVGKSTLFNALTENSVPAENYPFCTIDPSVGIVAVPDERLEKLHEFSKSEKKIPITKLTQFVHHTKQAVSYTITLEPHQKKWLFTLEMPDQVDGDTIKGFYFNQDLQLLNQTNIRQLTQYHVTSMTDFKLNSMNDSEMLEERKLITKELSRFKLGYRLQSIVKLFNVGAVLTMICLLIAFFYKMWIDIYYIPVWFVLLPLLFFVLFAVLKLLKLFKNLDKMLIAKI